MSKKRCFFPSKIIFQLLLKRGKNNSLELNLLLYMHKKYISTENDVFQYNFCYSKFLFVYLYKKKDLLCNIFSKKLTYLCKLD